MAAFTAVCLVKFEAGSGTNTYNEIIDKMPKLIKSFFGITGMDLGKFIDYIGVCYVFFLLLSSIYAATLGSSIICKEVRDKTSEFLLIKPVKRHEIITAKLFTCFIYVCLFTMINYFVLLMISTGYTDISEVLMPTTKLFSALFLVAFMFSSMGVMFACVLKDSKRSVSISMSVILGFYFATSIFDMLELPQALKFLIPFQYFKAWDIIKGAGISPVYVCAAVAVVAVLLVLSYRGFNKRDMNI